MVRLRPHHLLCILTFAGKGYSPGFVQNLQQVVDRIAHTDDPILIVDGPDDICAPLLTPQQDEATCHCLQPSVQQRDHLAAEALTNLLQLPIQPGQTLQLQPPTLHLMRTAFAAGTLRAACNGCQWKPFCDSIAHSNFTGTRLLLPNPRNAPETKLAQ